MDLKKYRNAYEAAGLKVTPLRDKRPILPRWYEASATDADWAKGNDIGLVCGQGLEAVDVDLKYDLTGDLWTRLQAAIGQDLLAKLVIQRTRSGGYHLLYFCEEVEGNQKLASRPATEEELEAAPGTRQYVLIETRGEHGQVVIFPSEGYRFVQRNPLEIQQISVDERARIMEACRSFDLMPAKKTAPTAPVPNRPAPAPASEEAKPWEIYDAETTALEVLEQHGWTVLRHGRDGKGRELVEVVRPGGDTSKKSASYYPDNNIVYSHTTSSELPSETPLRPSAVLAYLAYGGDFSRMGRELRQKYYDRYAKTQPSQPAPQQPQAPQPKAVTHKDEGFFAPLGIEKADGTTYLVFFSHRMGVITRLSPSSLTTNNLLTLAPLNWWESRFPSSSKQSKFDTAAAADFLYEACSIRGFFDPLLTRGRGAWEDRGRIVINTGQNLIVDGQAMDFRDLETKYVYEAGLPLDIHTQNPMQTQEATLLYDACKLAFWEREVNAGLLAGWVAIAPICGAFNWRPHIWMTGPAGSGKSSLWKNLVMKVLAEVAIHAQGETTLPGLRNALGIDGRPVVFDEFEITDKNSQERAQQLLGFARACSSDGSGLIYKGASNGTTRQYQPRAAFALASIGLGLIEQSDRRRFTVLQTKKVARTEETKRRLNLQADLCLQFDKDYRRRLQARIISMLPTILHNTEVFGDVASAKLGGAAYGDQLGPMLAGWAALLSDKRYTIEEAKEFILGHDWGMEEELADTRDEVACLNYLMQCSVEVDGEFGRVRRTIGELIQTVQGRGDFGVSMANADARLKRAGMRVDTVLDDFHKPNWFLIVANTSKEVKDLLRGKETWANNHAQILKRLDGADTTGQPIRFGSIKARGVIIPLPEEDE